MTVEIRRRRGLLAIVFLLAGGLAAWYLWRFAVAGGTVLLGIGVPLAAIALWYGAAWFRASTPLFVADSTGLRVRLASAWTGVPWEEVDRVEAATRGRVRDGRLLVFPVDGSAALAGVGRLARLDAAFNRRLYGAALAVPYGLATTVSVVDLPGELRQLAEARADVVVLGEEKEPAASELGGADGSPAGTVDSAPVDQPARAHVAGAEPPTARSLRPWAGAATALASASASASASAFPARREEVTLAMRRETVDGSLALSAPTDDELTEELPEISELRRTAGSVDEATSESDTGTSATSGTSGGNVSLIIDATTDLSAQAMRKVRRPVPERVKPVDDEPPPNVADEEESDDTVRLGAELRRARENLGLTVEDLADRTRIRPFVIECMEANDFSACGGDFYARGHLRMLARVLGVASEPLVLTYDSHFARTPVSLREVFEAEHSTGVAGMVRGSAAGASWGGLIAAVVILAIVWGVARYFADDTGSPAPPTSHSMSSIVDSRSGLSASGSSVPGGHTVGL
jgi:cytoskeleton protein RodZ